MPAASGCVRISPPQIAHVFPSDPDGSRPWVPNGVTKRFIRIRQAAGLESVRLHDLRRFTATRSYPVQGKGEPSDDDDALSGIQATEPHSQNVSDHHLACPRTPALGGASNL